MESYFPSDVEAELKKNQRREASHRHKTERECHARPRDHNRRYTTLAPRAADDDFGQSYRARPIYGSADDLTTSAPDDDISEHLFYT